MHIPRSTVSKATMFVISLLMAVSMATDASAYYTYTYSGSQFTSYDPNSNPMNFQSIQGFFTVDNQLDPNRLLSPVPYTSFSFTANNGAVTYTSQDLTVSIGAFAISTFNGQLNGWDIDLKRVTTGTLPEGDYSFQDDLQSDPNLDLTVRSSGNISWNPPPPPPFVSWAMASVTYVGYQGQWTSEESVPGPVPEPTTMLLLGSGLIGLAGYGRKKFFKK